MTQDRQQQYGHDALDLLIDMHKLLRIVEDNGPSG